MIREMIAIGPSKLVVLGRFQPDLYAWVVSIPSDGFDAVDISP
jgi:hypothetical protein